MTERRRSEAFSVDPENDLPDFDPSSPERRGRERVPRGLMLDPPSPDPDHPAEIPLDRLDVDAVKVIARLRHMGHQAYLVGGCVRDVLLGKTPKDFDVATSAHPGEVRAIFRNCRLIGRRFRLAHVYYRGGKVIEVATFRKNPVDAADDLGEAANGDLLITRDNVFGTAEEDSVRRDFTVNGLFYDTFAGAVIDYVGGRADLEAHRISTIGDPEIRMREDPVRALRAVRFAARLGFTIAPETFAAMRRHSGELARCAPPRLLEEIFKILRCGASSRAFELLRTSGALPVVLPAIAAFLDRAGDAGRRNFSAHLGALDGLVRSGAEVSDAALLGTLLVHLPPAGEGEVVGAAQDELLDALVSGSRLPRKIAERSRLALSAQRLFREGPRRKQRSLPSQSYYDDALQLLEVTARATGEDEELVDRWKSGEALADDRRGPRHPPARAAARHGPGADAHAPAGEAEAAVAVDAAEGGDEQARKRRRRRGGRRRRRRGDGAAARAGNAP
jgi:poly(A) polymerase